MISVYRCSLHKLYTSCKPSAEEGKDVMSVAEFDESVEVSRNSVQNSKSGGMFDLTFLACRAVLCLGPVALEVRWAGTALDHTSSKKRFWIACFSRSHFKCCWVLFFFLRAGHWDFFWRSFTIFIE